MIGLSFSRADSEFDVASGDFSQLTFRDSGNNTGFWYFYDEAKGRLITDFILENRDRVATLCNVKLIRKGDRFSPRIRLWKKDKTKAVKQIALEEAPNDDTARIVKASVDTGDCHETFWKLIGFLQSLRDIDLPDNPFRVFEGDQAALIDHLAGEDRATVIAAVRAALGGSITEADIAILANRKGALDVFRRLLSEDGFVDEYKAGHDIGQGEEAAWQHFFEANQWIFGYGLSLIPSRSFSDRKLEQITTGANIFSGAGKRSDAVLRSRGFISSLLFAEIKKPSTFLLVDKAYRPPDVFQPSSELTGAVAQLQKTADKAVRGIVTQFHRAYSADGTPLGFEVSTIKPKQVLIIGKLDEFAYNGDINPEKSTSFELYRRSIVDVEIITFDELYERALFILGDD